VSNETTVNIEQLKQGDTITFANGLTALVCNVIHDKADKHAHLLEYHHERINETD